MSYLDHRSFTKPRAVVGPVAFGPPRPGTKAACRVLVARVAHDHRVSVANIMERSRILQVMRARHAAIAAVASHMPKWSLPRLGRFFNRNHTTVLSSLRRSGLVHRSGMPSLAADDVLAIRECLQAGESARTLAIVYGVSHSTVNDIRHRRTWKSVP